MSRQSKAEYIGEKRPSAAPCTTYFVAELPRIVRCPASWIAAMRAAGWAPFARRLG